MNREVKVVYILPDKAVAGNPQACPVIYLLHGYGGNARTWMGVKPELPRIADEKGVIFACPDGKTVGIGTVPGIPLIVMKLSSLRNW